MGSNSPSRGLLVVISAPSGGGKTTLAHELIQRFDRARRAITYTTRPARSTEIADQDYHFVSDAEFEKMVGANAFAEWAKVHSHRYGIAKSTIAEAIERNEILILTIDVQGAATVKKQYPNSLTVFVGPPDFDVLESRLRKRGTEDEKDVQRRLENARKEMARAKEFDFQVLNDRLERVALEIESIIQKRLANG